MIPIVDVSGMWFVDRRHGFGVVDRRLVRTDDAGRRWRVVGSPIPPDDLGFVPVTSRFTSLSVGYLYGRGLRVTQDGGATWHAPHLNRYVDERDGPLDAQVLALEPRGASVWALVTCAGNLQCIELHASDDAGLTWHKQSRPMLRPDRSSADLARVSDTKAYAVAAVGLEPDASGVSAFRHIAVTEDAGTTWRYLPDPCRFTLSQFIAATSEQDIWLACGGEPATAMGGKEVLHSSDGGEHWELRSAVLTFEDDVGDIPASGHLGDLVAVSPTRAYLGLGRFTQIQTTDGGRTWNPSFLAPGGADGGGGPITFVDPTHGWGSGDFYLYQTTNGVDWRLLGGGRD